MTDHLAILTDLRRTSGPRMTEGLSDTALKAFLATDPRLGQALEDAKTAKARLSAEFPAWNKLEEGELIARLQDGLLNFYPDDQRNPYVPIAARGPWIVTFHGAVLHDSGGYGMIGFGHAPDPVLKELNTPVVMANVMTASFSQARVIARLRKEIGHARQPASCPYSHFVFLNSGSESVTVATRISDINAKQQTDPGGRHVGKRLMYLVVKGAFHGRTERPAMLSDSSQKAYRANLASYRNLDQTYTVPAHDEAALRQAFAWADTNGVFFESMYLEPVMGEGDPGKALPPAFYRTARELTAARGTLLVVDSIQAGLRANGCLSIVDYPGFTGLEAPDMETYSKALNAGQFPLSILALSARAAALYARGVYGNTKTANPRALDIATAVLGLVTPALRENIRARGQELLDKFTSLKAAHPDTVLKVQGTGLLVAMELNPAVFKVVGHGHVEEYLRRRGIGVIHGGANALRFTPHFGITSAEVDLVVAAVQDALQHGPRLKPAG